MLSAAQSGAGCFGVQFRVSLHRLKTMVPVCAYPNCKNRMTRNTPYSFHRLPLSDGEMLKMWLVVLQMDANTPVQTLRLADHRVCSAHFSQDDYCQPKKRRHPIQHLFLKKTAVPREERATDTVEMFVVSIGTPAWIGLTDRVKEGTWKWIDGTPLTLSNWGKNQPDNGGGDPQFGEEDCAHMRPDRVWNDLSCNTLMRWICEKTAQHC